MSEISDLCMHKDIEMLKLEMMFEYGLPYENTNPLKECMKCRGYNELCGLYHPIQKTNRSKTKNDIC